MNKVFQKVGALHPGTTLLPLSYDKLIDMDMGEIHIAQCDEVVPGDVWRMKIEAVVRMQPAVAPFLHNTNMVFYSFFVPYRILDENWEEFITGGEDGESSATIPRWIPPEGGYDKHTPWDDLGFPVGIRPSEQCCPISYPLRARNLCYNEYFRDENYQEEIDIDNDELIYINWEKDMFTSALPFQQRGTSPAIPLSGTARVMFTMATSDGEMPDLTKYYETLASPRVFTAPNGIGTPATKAIYDPKIYANQNTTSPLPSGSFKADGQGEILAKTSMAGVNSQSVANTLDQYARAIGDTHFTGQTQNYPYYAAPLVSDGDNGYLPPNLAWQTWLNNHNFVDLSQVGNLTSTDLRIMMQVQKWLERNARGGVRYTEFLQSHFGIKPRDERLQRPEYLGGYKAPLVVSEVVQTSSTDTETPQGNLAGHGLVAARGNLCSYRVVEYGCIITLCAIRPKAMYTQGIDRQWLRRSRYDFFFPEFVNLSEQGIEAEELYAVDRDYENIIDPDTSEVIGNNNRKIIAYTGKYDEMRSKRSVVCGDMRDKLKYWTLARMFNEQPAINGDFIVCHPSKRVFAVQTDEDKAFICHLGFIITAGRPMPLIAEPGLTDHH